MSDRRATGLSYELIAYAVGELERASYAANAGVSKVDVKDRISRIHVCG